MIQAMVTTCALISPLPFPYAGEKRAVVARPRACTLCRQCVMGPTGEVMGPTVEQVELRRVRDHFICK